MRALQRKVDQVAVFQDHESEWMGWVDIWNNFPIKGIKIKLGEMEDSRNKERNNDKTEQTDFSVFSLNMLKLFLYESCYKRLQPSICIFLFVSPSPLFQLLLGLAFR